MMLQRAASNAYSWWWASHIRTKQSKWLEQNLQEMEDRVNYTLKIIDEDGDTFAQKAEMYYKKRPEIVNFVQEAFRSYRALAERYDHLSKDLQSANRTIATAFPEQIPFALDIEDVDDENPDKQSKHITDISPGSVPKVPEMPKKDSRSPALLSRKQTLRRNPSSTTKAVVPPSSGLSRNEALGEIDKLQKGILALQTERGFVKGMYEHGYEKYCEIENEIDEMQKRVSNLQDEFGLGNAIDDREARALMAGTTIKSCKETLAKLQEKQKQSEEEAKVEKGRVREALEKFEALKKDFLSDKREPKEHQATKSVTSWPSQESDIESLSENIKKEIESDSRATLTVTQLAEKIDELVEKVVSYETATCSQTALANRLRSDTDELHLHIHSLEEEKETLVSSSEDMNKRIRVMEEELCRIRSLCQRFEEQNKNLRANFAEATCSVDHLSGKLHDVRTDEEVENAGLFEEERTKDSDVNLDESTEEHPRDVSVVETDVENKEETKKEDVDGEENAKPDFVSEKPPELTQEEKSEEKDLSEGPSTGFDTEPQGSEIEDDENQHEWRQMLPNGIEEREKDLLDEYTLVLRNYRDVKKKLSNVEKKNRDGFFELALQIRELKNAVTYRDVEIESLCSQLYSAEKGEDQAERNQSEDRDQNQEEQRAGISQLTCSSVSSFSSPSPQGHIDPKNIPAIAKGNEVKAKQVAESPRPIPSVEQRIREDIDELLEENLEFWLRFSTLVHHIQKFQTSVQDLKSELLKVNEKRKQAGNNAKSESHSSDTKPIYRHLREIRTELQLWLENNAVLKDEVQARYSCLCSIQDEISRVTHAGPKGGETELSEYQSAKFHGQVLNMKQENTKVSNELQADLDCVRMLKVEVERILAKLEEDIGISATKNTRSLQTRSPTGRPRIPLRSFLFGVKLRKQKQQKSSSIFSCVTPSLQKQYSYIAPAERPGNP